MCWSQPVAAHGGRALHVQECCIHRELAISHCTSFYTIEISDLYKPGPFFFFESWFPGQGLGKAHSGLF